METPKLTKFVDGVADQLHSQQTVWKTQVESSGTVLSLESFGSGLTSRHTDRGTEDYGSDDAPTPSAIA
jgi:hypothetical protein